MWEILNYCVLIVGVLYGICVLLGGISGQNAKTHSVYCVLDVGDLDSLIYSYLCSLVKRYCKPFLKNLVLAAAELIIILSF